MNKPVTIPADVRHPLLVQSPCVLAYRFAVFVEVAPAHKLLDVLNLNVVGIDSLDIAEQVFGQRPAVGITGLPTFGLAEIRTFEARP